MFYPDKTGYILDRVTIVWDLRLVLSTTELRGSKLCQTEVSIPLSTSYF